MAAANPDVVVGGTQSLDAFAEVKAMIQLKFNPKWLFLSNGANSPTEFPDKVGANNVDGVFSSGDWYPGLAAAGSRNSSRPTSPSTAETPTASTRPPPRRTPAGMLLEQVAKKTGKVDNATIIKTLHSGTWPTLVRRPELGHRRRAAGRIPAGPVDRRQAGHGVPARPRAQHAPIAPKPAWAG